MTAATPVLAEAPHVLGTGLAAKAQVRLSLVDSSGREHRLLVDGMVVKTILRRKLRHRQEQAQDGKNLLFHFAPPVTSRFFSSIRKISATTADAESRPAPSV